MGTIASVRTFTGHPDPPAEAGCVLLPKCLLRGSVHIRACGHYAVPLRFAGMAPSLLRTLRVSSALLSRELWIRFYLARG